MNSKIFGIPVKSLRFPQRLWFKFQWYKYIKKVDILGFYAGIPIVRYNNIMEELKTSFLHKLWKE